MKPPPPASSAAGTPLAAWPCRSCSTAAGTTRFVQEVLDRPPRAGRRLSPADRRLATQLAYGVLRRRGTLDALLRPLVNRPPAPGRAVAVGRAAPGRVPARPADAHPAARRPARDGRAGRRLRPAARPRASSTACCARCRSAADRRAMPRPRPPTPCRWRTARYRRLARPVLPDPAADPVEYLAAGLRPAALAGAALAGPLRLGRVPAPRLLVRRPGPAVAARATRCGPTATTLLAALAEAGVAAEPGEHPQAVRLAEHAADPRPARLRRGLVRGAGRVGDARRRRPWPRSRAAASSTCAPPRAARRRTWPS